MASLLVAGGMISRSSSVRTDVRMRGLTLAMVTTRIPSSVVTAPGGTAALRHWAGLPGKGGRLVLVEGRWGSQTGDDTYVEGQDALPWALISRRRVRDRRRGEIVR